MKKAISLLLVVLLLYGLCSVSCFAEEEKSEILFRNIPWGSSVADTISLLKKDLGSDINFRKTDPARILDGDDFGYYNDDYCLLYYTASCSGLKVAGVKVAEIQLFFIPEYNSEQHTLSEDEGRLIQAGYWFRQDPKEINQISKKLDDIYGEHSTVTSRKMVKVTSSGKQEKVEFNCWQIDGKYIEAVPIQIKDIFTGKGYYYNFTLVYSDRSEAVSTSIKEMRAVKKYIDEEPMRRRMEEQKREEEEKKNNTDGL